MPNASRALRRPVRKLRRALGCALLLALAAAQIGGSRPDSSFDRIVLVSIDTLRADHLGTYGYPRPISGFIDQMADDGAVFERAYASMSTTGPSHATMLTGLHPIQHGVKRNGRRLADEWTTVAEMLAARGFSTAGFSGTRVHFRTGNLDQGFDHFDEPPGSLRAPYQPADQTLQAARNWLRSQPNDRPLFLLLHLFDVHHPWNPPEIHRRELARRSEEVGFQPSYWNEGQHVPIDFYAGQIEQMRATIDSYDAEIRFVDTELRRFAVDFSAWADGRPTLWIVTSDHGEGLGNHGWLFHGKHIYDEQVRVPLIFHASDHRYAHRRIKEIVQHVDLLPTILDLASMPSRSPAAPNARSAHTAPRTGRSLAGLLQGAPWPDLDTRGAFVQRRSFDPNPAADARASRGEIRPDNRYESGETYAWIEGRWKLIHRTIGRDELFDLEADPYEMRNLAGDQSERLRQMRAALEERLSELGVVPPAAAPPVARETLDQLEALGYLP
ncbi:MAG: sulfatase [Myxococcota bacterium]